MKHYFQNSLRALFLSLSVFLSLPIMAVCVEIDGINYDLVEKTHEATVLYKSSGSYSGDIVIPESVEYEGNYPHEGTTYRVISIGFNAFRGCSGLTSVTIPNSVAEIGIQAFDGCSGLTSVTIPNSVHGIGKWAFRDCTGLTSVTIGNGVSYVGIGDEAFKGCTGLTSVHISDLAAWCKVDFASDDSNPLNYAHHLFLNGEEVKDLVIPNGVQSIGEYAFYRCFGLTSVTIPNSVTSIEPYAFWGCPGLTSVIIPDNVTYLGERAFQSCPGLTSATIGNSVTSIGEYAFSNCTGLASVIIGNSVTSIEFGAFAGCGLKSVTIPNSVTSIGSFAFQGCLGLTSATIGNSVKRIEKYAFADCRELLDVYCYADKAPYTGDNVFKNSYIGRAYLHVPAASIENYKAKTPWNEFGKIVALTEEGTDIEKLKSENGTTESMFFDLNGRRVQKAQKGIYIQNRKKVLVK